ncbi:carbohydrate ABC transporter permease [Eubacteriales bacterium mix99]|nr:sugar ABC transporter permease [Clostridiales bacterium]
MVKNRLSIGDRIFYIIDYIFVALVAIVALYPFIFIFSASVSNSAALGRGEIWLFPKGFNTDAYEIVLEEKAVWSSYGNTIWYVVVGTTMNMVLTTFTAYPLSRKNFSGRNKVMMFIAFTMFFSGGLVPSYLLVKKLGLIDTRWAIVIPAGISTWNLIIMRTFFESIPQSLHEAATIDGCSELRIMTRIFLPLSLPVLSVMVLFYAVAHWNSYFSALVYLNDQKLYPLQMHLRKILIQYNQNEMLQELTQGRDVVGQSVRYATIIVSTVPILLIYPFLQKYFVKGVMVGAIKG